MTRHGSCPAKDDNGLADYRTAGNARAKAISGSRRLRDAILRLQYRLGRTPRVYRRYGTWDDRQLAHRQIERLQRVVASHFGLPAEVMKQSRGSGEIARKRQVAMYLAREVIQSSYPDIGRCFGGKDHSTVIYACQMMAANPDYAADIAALRERLGG